MKNVIWIITNLIKIPVQGQKIEMKKIKHKIKIELSSAHIVCKHYFINWHQNHIHKPPLYLYGHAENKI